MGFSVFLLHFLIATASADPCVSPNEAYSTKPLVNQLRSQNCDPFNGEQPPMADGALTPSWNLDYMGTDLAKDEIKATPNVKSVSLGILDSCPSPSVYNKHKFASNSCQPRANFKTPVDFGSSHGEMSWNAVSDRNYGTSSTASIESWEDPGNPQDVAPMSKQVKTLTASNAQILSSSNDPHVYASVATTYHEAIDKGKIVVHSAGNGYSTFSFSPEDFGIPKHWEDSGVITVGSLSPLGFVSDFSNQGSAVTILAPCDWRSYNKENSQEEYSGTSCSAPLVAGVVADIKALLPEANSNDIKKILCATAVKSMAQLEGNKLNGCGTVNHIKAVLVAKALRAKMDKEGGKLSDFDPAKVKDFTQDGQKLFESAKNKLKTGLCGEEARTGIKDLRRSFLLSGNENARKALVAAYEQLGYYRNADFLKSLNPNSTERMNYFQDKLSQNIIWPPGGFSATPYAQGYDALIFASRFPADHRLKKAAEQGVALNAQKKDIGEQTYLNQLLLLYGANAVPKYTALANDPAQSPQMRKSAKTMIEMYKDLQR